ncbi:MAG TPA: hypothetical protein PKJ92_16415, partial [Accumulibacter sp.]|nr:hypothetical protein [Accumulibacter sp.]
MTGTATTCRYVVDSLLVRSQHLPASLVFLPIRPPIRHPPALSAPAAFASGFQAAFERLFAPERGGS